MDIVAADILSGLPITDDGMRYILVFTDYFTKWACTFALPDCEASTCMRVMYDGFFAQFGLPNQIHMDQGQNFESRLFHELYQLTAVTQNQDHTFSSTVTGVTPNIAMLGREVLLPASLIARPPTEPVRTTVPFVTSCWFANSYKIDLEINDPVSGANSSLFFRFAVILIILRKNCRVPWAKLFRGKQKPW